MSKKAFVDIEPGEIFEAPWGLGIQLHLYLKLCDQKAVNLTTYSVFTPQDQHEEVLVKPYNVDVYLWNGGLRPTKQ